MATKQSSSLHFQPTKDTDQGEYDIEVSAYVTYASTQPILTPCTMHVVVLGCDPADLSLTLTVGDQSTFSFAEQVS